MIGESILVFSWSGTIILLAIVTICLIAFEYSRRRWLEKALDNTHNFIEELLSGGINITINNGDTGDDSKLDYLIELVEELLITTSEINIKENAIMTDLSVLEAEVAENTSVDESAIALITGLAAKVQDLADQLTAAGVDATKVQELADNLNASNAALAAAVAANTPAAPAPTPEPTPDPGQEPAPVDPPVDTPVDVPVDVPVDAPVDTPVDPAPEVPVEG